MLVLGLLVSRYKYRMFSDEILELKQYNGIRDVSKLDFFDSDQDIAGNADFEASVSIHKFFDSISEKNNAKIQLYEKHDGTCFLYDVLYREGKYYVIKYNTQTDSIDIQKYSKLYKLQGTYTDSRGLNWEYEQIYLEGLFGKKQYLWTVRNLCDGMPACVESFVGWIDDNFKRIQDIDIEEYESSSEEIVLDMNTFYRESENNNPVQYLYMSYGPYSKAISLLCYANNNYYHVTYFYRDDIFAIHTFKNLYIIDDEDGEQYILSNSDRKTTYKYNNVFSYDGDDLRVE